MKVIISGSLSTQLLSTTVTDILLIKTVTHTVIRLNEVIRYIQEWICYIMWAVFYMMTVEAVITCFFFKLIKSAGLIEIILL